MRLYLVQHGKACSKDVDPERPLTPSGRREAGQMAGFLNRAGVQVQRVVHSGKLRAVQTAELLAAGLGCGTSPEARDGIKPNDDPGAIDWERETAQGDVLVTGHLPFLGRLLALLVTGQDEPPLVAYRPGTVVCLERDQEGDWAIAWMVRPELLAD